MNDSSKNETEAIRSDIDTTRRRMDDTMEALGDRLQPRHLLDEVLGFLRGNSNEGDSRLHQMRERLGHSCNTAMHSVVDSVKQNPMPAVLIGAGVAWMIYSSRRDRSDRFDYEDAAMRYNPDTHYDRPLEYPASERDKQWNEQDESTDGSLKDQIADKASAAGNQVKEKLAQAGEAARGKIGELRDRAGQVSARVRDGTRETYARARERVVSTADHHPLEVGLVALAAGLIAGLAIPTPNAINRSVGPTADRLRQRTREAGTEMINKGKRVAEAAVTAVKEEAEAQGLTPERLRDKAAAVAERAKEAGKQSASREGLTPASDSSANAPGSDPTFARPAV